MPVTPDATAEAELAQALEGAIRSVNLGSKDLFPVLVPAMERVFDELDFASHARRREDVLRKLRGLTARRWLETTEGGSLSSGETAGILGISRQAVDERRKRRRLLAFEQKGHGWRYPAWQFDAETEDRMLDGLVACLAELPYPHGMPLLRFFLSPSERLDGETPLEALRHGRQEPVIHLASTVARHGGR